MDLLRKARAFTRIPAIAMTGYGMAEDVEECLAAGFQTHPRMRVHLNQLCAAIDNPADSKS
jgi:CheY-like chemotaxis protein